MAAATSYQDWLIAGAQASYVNDRIILDEYEQQVAQIIRDENPSLSYYAALAFSQPLSGLKTLYLGPIHT